MKGNFLDIARAKTWDDATNRWIIDQSDKASLFSDKSIIRWLDMHLSGVPLADIDRDVIANIHYKKLASGVANATVNRTLALLRSILNTAEKDWRWVADVPRIKLMREPLRRVRYLSKGQAISLLRELPEHLSDMAAFSLATGLRKTNVTGLEWTQVNMQRKLAWIHADQAKSGKSLAVPLNTDALVVLSRRRGRHSRYVFTYKGERINQTSTAAWYKALRRAGISDFRWHDLRHTWASWHVQCGTPLYVLQELGGWHSYEMVRRYAHLSAAHLAIYAEKMTPLTLEASIV
jgi:integrase